MILKRKAYLSGSVSKSWSEPYSYSVAWADDWRWSRDWKNGWFLNTLRAYYRQSKGGPRG
jgi:hypothetical protein